MLTGAVLEASEHGRNVTTSAGTSDLGSRLRRTRLSAGYTLDWTATKAGLTKGYLSKVERGQATPSIAVINRLSEIYGVTVAEFFMPEGERKPIIVLRANERRTINRSGSELGYRYEVGDFSKINPRAEVFFLTLPCLTHPEKVSRFSHSGEEVLLMLDGQIVFNYAGVEIMLYEGDCIQFEARIEHFGYAVGGKDAHAFVVTIPDAPSQR